VRFILGKCAVSRSTPLPPMPLKALTGTGSAKMPCKILSPGRLGIKILIANHLAAFPEGFCLPLARWK
jgi:hypothetical protein